MKFTLYGRAGCHLCEDMAAGLEAMGLAYDEVDIDRDPELKARYDWDVPVLLGPAGEVCRHFFDPVAVRTALEIG
ncbi:MAG: glutaredoxin family protein [Betaproteobacteria bacterium]|nr:glutaredoxin family protein [Betaproteobacteria bacterium]